MRWRNAASQAFASEGRVGSLDRMSRRVANQPDLFLGPQADLFAGAEPSGAFVHPIDLLDEHPGEPFINGIRMELNGYLDLARASDRLPWRKHKEAGKPDLTKAYSIHMRLNSMSRWLPREEGTALRRAFWDAMDRLYELENEATPLVPMMDF
jgi:hypothetical protein